MSARIRHVARSQLDRLPDSYPRRCMAPPPGETMRMTMALVHTGHHSAHAVPALRRARWDLDLALQLLGGPVRKPQITHTPEVGIPSSRIASADSPPK